MHLTATMPQRTMLVGDCRGRALSQKLIRCRGLGTGLTCRHLHVRLHAVIMPAGTMGLIRFLCLATSFMMSPVLSLVLYPAAASCNPRLPAMPSITCVDLCRCCVLKVRITLPAAISRPSKHLWLGNMQLNVNKSALDVVFGNFGTLESVRIFPGKTYAFVNFANIEPAVEAMRCLDGQPLLSITGGTMQLALLVLHLPVLHHAVLSSASPFYAAVLSSASPCVAIQTAG